MSLPITHLPEVPAETARVARKAFRKGHPWLQLRDELPDLYNDQAFADLYPATGQPAYAPWRLALVCVLQFAAQLTRRPVMPYADSSSSLACTMVKKLSTGCAAAALPPL